MKASMREHEGAVEPQAQSNHANQYPAQPPGSALSEEETGESSDRRAQSSTSQSKPIGREELVDLLNGDLAREYQAIIAYVVYSQTLKGAAYMAIAKELESHAAQELSHAITVAKHIEYLGGTPAVTPEPVKVTDDATGMLRADLDNEVRTIRAYRERLKQCEALEEFAIAEDLREILREEQDHLVDLATSLGEDVPDLTRRT